VTTVDAVRRLAAGVPDPELPVLTIEDLGILRDVHADGAGRIVVDLTPTYSGCPAVEAIREDVERTLRSGGFEDVTVRMVMSPAWTTDWMTETGRQKLREHGVAPPRERAPGVRPLQLAIVCPRCGSARTDEVSHFGSTQCQAIRHCLDCRETFPHFKEH